LGTYAVPFGGLAYPSLSVNGYSSYAYDNPQAESLLGSYTVHTADNNDQLLTYQTQAELLGYPDSQGYVTVQPTDQLLSTYQTTVTLQGDPSYSLPQSGLLGSYSVQQTTEH
jgi:hypothetical protein